MIILTLRSSSTASLDSSSLARQSQASSHRVYNNSNKKICIQNITHNKIVSTYFWLHMLKF